MSETIEAYGGWPVVATPMIVRKTGDGLSASMKVEPRILQLDDVVYVVMKCVVAKVTYGKNKDDDQALDRIHVLDAQLATFIDEKIVAKALAAEAEKQAKMMRAKQELKGQLDIAGDAVE